jgi:asparagine synthase (glutamine-hydrolysing)
VVDHEEPVRTSSVYAQWCVMRDASERGVVVLLDGQGADELLGGYQSASAFALQSEGLRRSLLHPRRLEVLAGIGATNAPRALVRRYRKRRASPYASHAAINLAASTEPQSPAWSAGDDPLRRELSLELTVTSLPELLRYADRNSMAHSREVRLPFLDRRIVDFALGLPPQALYDGHETKHVLREAVRSTVPAAVLERRDKVGYETPESLWLASDRARYLIADVLLDHDARSRPWLDAAEVESDVRAGRWRDPGAIWRALNVEMWLPALASGLKPAGFHEPRTVS